MMRNWLGLVAGVSAWTAAMVLWFCVAEVADLNAGSVLAASPDAVPTITDVAPSAAPNDLDTPIVITGTGFAAVPTVTLGSTLLDEVSWVNAERLTATVPWGLITGTYTLTVTNPGGEVAALADAFTVTQGIGVWTSDGPYGGRVYELLVDPLTPNLVYATMPSAGVFGSLDGAAHWDQLLSDAFSIYIAMDAVDSDTLYAGGGGGLVRSVDGALSWELVGGQGCGIHHPVPHPSQSGIIYNAVRSCWDMGSSLSGVYRSADYGTTWITRTDGLTDAHVVDIAIQPQVNGKLLVGTESGNLFASSNEGETWNWVAQPADHVERLYFNPYDPGQAWMVTRPFPHEAPFLLRSTDPSLQSWTPITVTGETGFFGLVYALEFTSDAIWAVAGHTVYSSTNSGATWDITVEPYHPGIEFFAIDPHDTQRYFVAASGYGVATSVDGGQTWEDTNHGLTGIYPSMLVAPPADPDTVYAKGDLGLMWSFNGGHAWGIGGNDVLVAGGDPGADRLAADPITPTRLYFVGEWGHSYSAQALVQIMDKSDPGWQSITVTIPVSPSGMCTSMTAVGANPHNPGHLVGGGLAYPCSANPFAGAGVASLYLSPDRGQTWDYLGPTQPISWVSDIAFDAIDPDLIYAATDGTGLWKSTDGGATWDVTPHPDGRMRAIEIAPHPTLSGHLILSTSDASSGAGLYASQDAGGTWTFLHSNVGSPLVYAPTIPPTLYAGMASGEYYGLVRSRDNGQTWEPVESAGFPISLASGTDGERVVVYAGIAGGVAAAGAKATSDTIPGWGSIFGGGVYRFTTVLGGHQVYLPLVLRE